MVCIRQVLRISGLAFVLALATAGSGVAQDDGAGAFFTLQSSLGEVLGRVDQRRDINPKLAAALAQDINELQDRFSASGTLLPGAYARSLQYQADELAAAARMGAGVEAEGQIREVAADIALKVGFARSAGFGFGGPPQTLVNVTVETANEHGKIDGLLVRCSPRRYRDEKPMFAFTNPSSPTSHPLPPGRFTMMAIRDGKEVARQDVEIGLQGQREAKVVLLIP